MSCNKPLLAKKTDLLPSGKYKYMPIGRADSFEGEFPKDSILIPCGKCLGCRADYTREWADRMILELDHSKKAVFLTLTYDDDHLPVLYQVNTGQCEMTLQKRDIQLFFKRLRKRFKDYEIRYYIAGEYGPSTGRPHYHAILFGLGLSDFPDIVSRGNNELGQSYFSSDFLAKEVWKNGFCLLSDVSWKTCAYVSKYVRKKQFGLVSDEFIDRMKAPVFCESSRNPGIGMYYPVEHEDYIKSKYHFADQNGSVEVYFPKAFLKFLEASDPVKYEELKEQRKIFANDRTLLELKQTDLSLYELGEISENHILSTENFIDQYRII